MRGRLTSRWLTGFIREHGGVLTIERRIVISG